MDYRPSSQSSFISQAAAAWAIPDLEKKLAANPKDWEVLNNLGNAYFMCRQPARALELFIKANDEKPEHSVILSNIANACEDLCNFERASYWARKANAANPKDQYAAQVNAECLLRIGQWRMGHDLYERCRFSIPQCPFRKLTKEMTEGSLEGIRLLVLQEGGAGDVFLHFRFFKQLRDLGATITFAVDKRLHCLFELHPWLDKVIDADGVKVSSKDYDCWVSVMSLPALFAPTPATVQALWPGFYFHGQSGLRQRLIGGRLKVGICWQAGEEQQYHKHRSLEEAQLKRLLENKEVDWVCLQWPYTAGTPNPWGMQAVDISDWEKTAEALEDLDLLITVETGLMFLAAAIGTPTWVLLRNSYWYFLTHGAESVWFPNMRLFRSAGPTYDLAVRRAERALMLLGRPPGPPAPPAPNFRQYA